jgi:hypothetical protein
MFGEYVYSVRLKNMIQEIVKSIIVQQNNFYLDKTDSKRDFKNHATEHT